MNNLSLIDTVAIVLGRNHEHYRFERHAATAAQQNEFTRRVIRAAKIGLPTLAFLAFCLAVGGYYSLARMCVWSVVILFVVGLWATYVKNRAQATLDRRPEYALYENALRDPGYRLELRQDGMLYLTYQDGETITVAGQQVKTAKKRPDLPRPISAEDVIRFRTLALQGNEEVRRVAAQKFPV